MRLLNRSIESILDVGSGKGALSQLLRYHRVNVRYSVGIDRSLNFLYACQRDELYDDLLLADAGHLPFKPGSFDTIFLGDVIEHLHKDDGRKLIDDVEKIAKKQILVSTPVGFRGGFRKRIKGHGSIETYLMLHKSGWSPGEFKARNYIVRGDIIGAVFIPQILAYHFTAVCPLTYLLPDLSYHMVCAKSLEN